MPKEEIVQNAFETEVVEFGESGGRMDHYASAFGGIIHVNFGSGQPSKPKPLPIMFDGLVIGDSLVKKPEKPDTVGDIRMINSTVREGYHILAEKIDDFHQSKTPLDTVLNYIDELPKHCRTMVETSIRNRDLTQKALSLFTKGNITPKFMGEMLDQHHIFLRDGLKRSTEWERWWWYHARLCSRERDRNYESNRRCWWKGLQYLNWKGCKDREIINSQLLVHRKVHRHILLFVRVLSRIRN